MKSASPGVIKPIKICFVLRMIGFGGAERQVVELCRGMDKKRFDITVVLFFHDEGFLEELKSSGVKVHILATRSTYMRTAIFQLIALLKKERFDVVQNMLPIANFTGGLAARIAGRSLIVGSLRNANPFSLLDPFCLMDLLALNMCCDQVIVNSMAGAKCAFKDYHLPKEKVRVIYNGKDAPLYQRPGIDANRVKEGFNIPADHSVVLTIGRITKQKGHKYFIEAANILARQKKEKITFLLVGKPEDSFPEVQSLIQKYSLEKNVRLLGLRVDIASIFHVADVFVLPSLWEGLPNVLLEAMIAKVPVVASDIESNREVIEPGKTGLLVPCANSQSLAEAIDSLLNNPQKTAAMAQAAHSAVLEKFSLNRLVKEHEEFYQGLCRQ